MAHMHHFPAWMDSNPYTNMLHQGVLSSGWRVSGTTTLDGLLKSLPELRAGDVFHIQWTKPILQDARSLDAARHALDRFRVGIEQARENGVFVLWTVHNRIPHESSYLEIEVELAEFLAATSDRILQLNSHTADAVSDLYTLPPEKLKTLPHASYVGMYGDPMPKAEARAALGIPASSPTIGFIGQIRHYKGLSTLFSAVERLSERLEDVTLLLAGKVAPSEANALETELPRGVRAVRWHGFLPDSEIATWFSAADVIALPYRRILNSGSMLLAATYGRPVVLPAERHLVDEFSSQDWVSFFDASDDLGPNLANAMHDAISTARQTGPTATSFAETYTMYDMAWGFLTLVEEMTRSGHRGE